MSLVSQCADVMHLSPHEALKERAERAECVRLAQRRAKGGFS